MSMNKRQIGSLQEERAEEYIKNKGYLVCQKNFQCRTGEIDLIAWDGDYLVFLEVKYRSSLEKGSPEDAITPRKIRQIVHTARYYMMKTRVPEDTPCRFDVVVILKDEIRLIQDAFDAVY